MRAPFGIWACLLVLPVAVQSWAADKPDTGSTGNVSCQQPDAGLRQAGLRGPKSELFNQQVQQFAACTGAEIARIREGSITAIRRISDTANTQIADIDAKIESARTGRVAVSPAEAGTFPAPECKEPDRSLLEPARRNGKIFRPMLVISPEYEAQEEKRKTCVATYIQQAFAERRQIEGLMNAQIKRIVDDGNGRVAMLEARLRALSASGPAGQAQAGAAQPLQASLVSGRAGNGVESVTVEGQKLRRSQDTPKGEGDPDAIACRTPQPLADSRLLGPEICKRNRDWAALYKAGSDISSDGRSVVPTEQSRTTNKAALTCFHGTFGGVYEEHITNEVCY